MDAFYICWKALLKESEKHQVFLWNTARKSFGKDHDFSIPVNRLEHVYLRGPLIINNLQDCVRKSITDQTLPIYRKLAEKDNFSICCLCKGPGLEAVGFLLGFIKHIQGFKSVSVTVISPFEEWRDISESLVCENLYHPTTSACHSPISFDFISCFSDVCSTPSLQCVQQADVIIMHKTGICSGIQSHSLLLKDITSNMKPGALLFFINTAARRKILNNFQDIGTSLVPFVRSDVENLPLYDASLSSLVGMPPGTIGRMRLTVWERHAFPMTSCTKMMLKNELPSKKGFYKKVNCSKKHKSKRCMNCKRSGLGSSSGVCEQKLDVNSHCLFNSNEPFCQPQIKSEEAENTSYESSSSDFKKNLSTNRIPEISSEMTVVKSEPVSYYS